MNLHAGNVSLFVEGRDGAAFVLWLCLGIAVVVGAVLLLPWPPDPGGAVMAAIVFAFCAAVAWKVGGHRELSVDRAGRTVVERVTFAGIPRERRWTLAGDAVVAVTQKSMKVSRPGSDTGHRTSTDYDSRLYYRLGLRSGATVLSLDAHDDVLEAEKRATEVAALCGVRAVRSSYAIEVERAAVGDVASAGSRQVVTVRNAPGTESPI